MNGHRLTAVYTVVLLLAMGASPGAALAQSGLDNLPAGWQSQAFGDFIATMHAASAAGLPDADRALAASQWMDANDWASGSRKHRVQLVELLNSDTLDKLRFSARWTGFLLPTQTGTFRLSLWDYYKETALDTKVWLNGDLVLDCSGPESDRVFQTGDIALTTGQRLSIRVELRFNRTPEHKIAKPNAILSWESATLSRQIIPESNLQPPDDYTSNGPNGLKGEYFSSDNFEGLVQTRLESELSYLWEAFAVAPEYIGRQRQIVEPMIPEILASLDDPTVVGIESADAFWCAYALEEVLITRESMQILNALKDYPSLNAARSPRDLFLFYWRFRYLPDQLGASLVAQWCKANPLRQSQFGTYPNYDLNEYYGNYNYIWRLGNHLTYTGDEAYLESMLVEADGSCNCTLASVLSFSHKKKETSDEWCAYLESEINDPAKSGDAKATWLLARGFAEEVRNKGEPNPLAGRRWLDQAFGEAQSQSMRLRMLGEIVCRLAAWDKSEEVNSLLAGLEPQFSSPDEQQKFADWRSKVDTIAAQFGEMRHAERQAVDQAYIDRLQERLSRALAGSNSDAVSELQQLISTAEAAKTQ